MTSKHDICLHSLIQYVQYLSYDHHRHHHLHGRNHHYPHHPDHHHHHHHHAKYDINHDSVKTTMTTMMMMMILSSLPCIFTFLSNRTHCYYHSFHSQCECHFYTEKKTYITIRISDDSYNSIPFSLIFLRVLFYQTDNQKIVFSIIFRLTITMIVNVNSYQTKTTNILPIQTLPRLFLISFVRRQLKWRRDRRRPCQVWEPLQAGTWSRGCEKHRETYYEW